MNEKIQHILNLVQQSCKLSEEEKEAIIKSLKDADKEISISAFKIERLEKVKYTTTVLLEQTIEELETKRKSVEEQKRELEIEAALERVRARTMAMQKSDELPQAANLLFQQVQSLGMPAFAAGYCIWEDDKQAITLWMSSEGILQPPFKAPTTKDELFIQMRKGYEEGKTLHVVEMGGEELVAHYQYMRTLPVVGDIFDSLLKAGHSLPAFQVMHQAYFSKGFLLFITYEPVPESHEIFKRFALVFDQTYTRFLDLQKAEAQSRESQIQLALERVRARTMAMQKSEELPETSYILFQQFKELGEPAEQLSIGVVHEENNVIEISATLYGDMLKKIYWHSIDEPYMMSKIYSAWKTQQKTLVVELKGDDLNAYNKYRNELTKSEIFPTNLGNEHRRIVYAAFFSKGMLALAANEPRPQESLELLQRFAAVFDLTYTRFLDLKNAEAQTRESQIQLALERVRARTMAMQHSDELSETAHILFQQFKHLGEDPIQITIGIFNEEQNVIEFRITGGDGSGSRIDQTFHADIDEPTLINKFFRAWKENKKSTIISLEGKELSQWIAYRNKISGEYAHETEVKSTDRRYAAAGFFSKGLLSVSTIKPPAAETIQILERFASVFDLTYTRFIDLKKAEAQIREARIEAALEKVRSRTLAMQRSDELAETAAVLFQQLIKLGIEPNRLYIGIINDESGDLEFWITDEDGNKVSNRYVVNIHKNISIKKIYEGWREKRKTLTIDMQGEELMQWLIYWNKEFGVPFKEGAGKQRRVQNISYFSSGFIAIASWGDQPQETVSLLDRFSAVFNLTYTRFNDLKVAEAHALQAEEDLKKLIAEKKRTEDALTELKATQQQLVHAEKMASLGELTAGIAHEIQNPLNFINNFSEVNKELLDEMEEEMLTGNIEEAKAIADDIKDNELKIMHHGKRADAIVKSMLQHSRKTSGQKEETNINTLVDEYLRLSYHGLRAKDKTFNAVLETHFDPAIGKVKIVGQDIGRVLLNLFNNAFYAVNEKKKVIDENYEPMVQVTTSKINGRVEIKVKDNGTGIPEKVLDKIYQPFFTTKPTGEGTGLGLSLSYDIITKGHGGEMKVQTKEGEGSEFVIQLPFD